MDRNRWTPLWQPGQLFQHPFGCFMDRLRAEFRLLYSLITHLRVNHYQEPITFRRLFSSLKRLVVNSLVLPDWIRRKAMNPPSLPALENEKVNKPMADRVPEAKIRRKALLIGIQRVREKAILQEVQNVQDSRPKRPKHTKNRSSQAKQMERGMLQGPHKDVAATRLMLEELYQYAPGDITMLIDDDDPNHLQPTRANIIAQIRQLVKDVKDGDRFFFHYSGHSGQHATTDIEEEDGMNEYILTCDGEEIMDNELRTELVDPLPPSCSLTAVLDSCHSCSLLDLVHFRCNRIYVPWLNKGRRRTDTAWEGNTRQQAMAGSSGSGSGSKARSDSQPLNFLAGLAIRSFRGMAEQLQAGAEAGAGAETSTVQFEVSVDDAVGIPDALVVSQKNLALSIHTAFPDPVRFIDSPASATSRQYDSPVGMYCHGNCRKDPNWIRRDCAPMADVVCLSSAKDSQRTWEDANGNSMTQCLVKILRDSHSTNRRVSLREVLTLISHDIHKYYIDLHKQSREYKKDVKVHNEQRIARGKEAKESEDVEMHNFQDPQLSSHRPLDMNRPFLP
ncbi:caspase domain-containing protein [Gymnopilus junonius]|uniref:Caspase domain-containing protein n=1 Tax=Gymnopilus junonius TaxID=109634 RepID=A0A9P5NUJ8_GYMJU|nr:caspase domain-containing protein [Gymnopilus junonius]